MNSQALIFLFCFTVHFSRSCQITPTPSQPRVPAAATPRSEALAPAAGRAPQAALVQVEGFAGQLRLALQAGEVLLVPGHPFCLLVVLREDDLRDKQTAARFCNPGPVVARKEL